MSEDFSTSNVFELQQNFFISQFAQERHILALPLMFLIMLPTTRYIVPLMMNGCAAPSQNEFLLRPHERHAFTSSPERFITVIKVLFLDVLPRNSPLASLPGTFDGHCEWVGFPFLSRWTSPAWIINSNRLCSEKQIASFKHEND